MNIAVIFHSDAQTDIEDAAKWYESQNLGLGVDFMRCVETTLLAIQRNPLLFPVVYKAFRRALMRRFPYAIFYEIEQEKNQCIVFSVFHCSQDPEKWRKRIT